MNLEEATESFIEDFFFGGGGPFFKSKLIWKNGLHAIYSEAALWAWDSRNQH